MPFVCLGGKKKCKSIYLEKERVVECMSWQDGRAAYWKPEYHIPQHCWSKEIKSENIH